MSGGVDSSVAALLLREEGYDVIGITMQIWDPLPTLSRKVARGCCSLEAVRDAQRVAEKLKIPHYVLNFREIFKEKVVDDFCDEYLRGRTPNPCIRCNEFIKFDHLLARARELDADFIATGHYARKMTRGSCPMFNPGIQSVSLYRGKDKRKDQSYFLYCLKPWQLSTTLFPLGDIRKEETRAIAARAGLPVADKKESQEICFVPDKKYGEFLQRCRPGAAKPGYIYSLEGKKIGEHQGLIFYTIGQRKGLKIYDSQPYYVVKISPDENAIYVGREKDLYASEFMVNRVNWISPPDFSVSFEAKVKVRYQMREQPAVIMPGDSPDSICIRFNLPQRAITPGQAAVIYQGEEVMGGGTIERVLSKS